VLGVEFEDVEEQVAFVHCNGNCDVTKDKVEYEGVQTCAGAKMLYGGKGSCTFGCLGLGDCAAACPQEAISIVNGVAKVDKSECIGCGICASKCPNRLISMVPEASRVRVLCSNRDKGAVTRKVCSNGCIGCKKCEKFCPAEAIKVTDNIARIDYNKCTGCGACAENCTTKCIATF
jgi:Pyruvate/2-oxoacid:ferredoxin oxidoreductase delta subunit